MDISLKARFLRTSRGNTLPHLLRARGRKEEEDVPNKEYMQ
jgi:hypothetical protein